MLASCSGCLGHIGEQNKDPYFLGGNNIVKKPIMLECDNEEKILHHDKNRAKDECLSFV